tara:strand:+ start:4128 stop:4442 length:315 start_codon:yes stop_codon:yes gene_type:complete
MKITENNVIRDMTSEEEAHHTKIQSDYVANASNRKLAEIRKIRNKKLSETDYLGLSDNSMSSDWVAKRKSWRDIPQDYTTESQYDTLLEKNDDGSLKHSIWNKP